MSAKCDCVGSGYYFDRRCTEKVCAHPEVGMDCPKRPCPCKLGNPLRQELKQIAEEQNERIKAFDKLEA